MYDQKNPPVSRETLQEAFKQTYLEICKEQKFDLFSTDASEGCENLFMASDVLPGGVCGHFAPSQNADELCKTRIRNILQFTLEAFHNMTPFQGLNPRIKPEAGFAAGNYTLQDLERVAAEILAEELKLRGEFFTLQKKLSERKAQMMQ